MNEDQGPVSVWAAVGAALKEPGLAIGAGISVLLFLTTTLVPVLGIFWGFFTPVPLVYLYYRGGRIFGLTAIGLASLAVLVIYAAWGRPLGSLAYLEYGLLSAVLAEGLASGMPPGRVIGAAAGAVLILGVVIMIAAGLGREESLWSHARLTVEAEIRDSIRFYQALISGVEAPRTPTGVTGLIRPEDQPGPESGSPSGETIREDGAGTPGRDPKVEALVRAFVNIFPGLVVIGTVLLAWANFLVGRALLRRSGAMPPPLYDLKNWQAAEGLIWPLIACGFAVYFFGGGIRVLAANGLLVLGLIYFFQGLAIVAHWMDRKQVPLFVRVLIYAVIAVQQYLTLIIAVLGLFDLWMDFRKLKTADEGETS